MRPIFKDISQTFITETIVLAGFIFIYRLIAKNFGPEGVGEYSLIRRVVSFIQPLLILGLGIGLPRYIAMSKDKDRRISYIKAGFLVITVFTSLFLIVINLFRTYFARTFFGNIAYTDLVLPFSFLLMGLISHILIYSYFRGRLFVKTFNSLQVINLSLIPIIILIFFKNITISKLIILVGGNTFVITFLFSLPFIKDLFAPLKKLQLKNSLKELFRYSLPRVPGDFALAGLFSLGPIFASHFTPIEEVGYLSVSQSLLIGMCGMVAPIGIILLPKVSLLIAQGEQETIRKNLDLFIAALFQCSIFVRAQLIIFTESIIKCWLGPEFFGAIPIMRIALLSTIFYTFYIGMRTILDATKVKPLNTINISISLGAFLLIAGMLLFIFKFFTPVISLSIAFSSGLMFLGILTYISLRKLYPENLKKDLKHFGIATIINLLLAGIAMSTKPFITSKLYYLIIFEIFLGIVYLSILWLLKMDWLRQILKRIS